MPFGDAIHDHHNLVIEVPNAGQVEAPRLGGRAQGHVLDGQGDAAQVLDQPDVEGHVVRPVEGDSLGCPFVNLM